MATYETLKTKIVRIEQELGEVRQALEQLATGVGQHRPVDVQWVDRAGWKGWFDEWFRQIGIADQPIGAEKLQKLMLQEGVQPEDNLLSQGIVAMREE